jgi:HAD superfamily hydrolase (TIGR01509 family)
MTTATLALDSSALDWNAIDTVLLDMDGTLLDLRFDNYFWQELVPQQYAHAHGLSVSAARDELSPRFAAHYGQLNWYCTDFWSRELQLNIAELKHEARMHIRWLHGAENFLRTLRAAAKKLLLVTNAHHDSLHIKNTQTGLQQHFDSLISSHSYGHPKEHATFWRRLHRDHAFDPTRTVFIDDSLPVLRAARAFGIAHVIAVTHPDSGQAPRQCTEFASVARVADLVSAGQL